MDYCPCCGKEVVEGEQVCWNCKQIAKEDKPVFIRMMIDDLKQEEATIKKRLSKIRYTINELERAERRL